MAEKRKARKRKEELPEKVSAEEKAIAKYLRHGLPEKKTMLFNHKVNYFIASKAVDCLLDSKWAVKNKSKDALFTTRESVVNYLELMLCHKFFHRARKISIASSDTKKKKKDESSDEKDSKKKKKSEKGEEVESKSKKEKKKDVGEDDKKKKKKFKLDMHLEQSFVDGKEIYVWIYDPIPTKAWIIGGSLGNGYANKTVTTLRGGENISCRNGLIVIGAILLCLFPLWPQSVRKGVYYLSIVAAVFLFIILGLAVLRVLVFGILWAVTFGKHHLWLLPNLTEDVGFVESFWPVYQYEYKGDEAAAKDKKSEEDTAETTEKPANCGSGTNEQHSDIEFEVLGAVSLEGKQTDEESES